MNRRCKQLTLFAPSKAGRPRVPGSISHRRRPAVSLRLPVHATLRVRQGVWNLRSRRCFRALGQAFASGRDRFGFRLVHYSVQGNHLHFIAEAPSAEVLARGMQGLAIRMAKGLNRLIRRRGPVFAARYHANVLRSPTQIANAVGYVLNNYALHRGREGQAVGPGYRDPFTSAWASIAGAEARGWLLREGWRRAVHWGARPAQRVGHLSGY